MTSSKRPSVSAYGKSASGKSASGTSASGKPVAGDAAAQPAVHQPELHVERQGFATQKPLGGGFASADQISEINLRQISHDLNNYLTILIIHCDQLRSELTAEEQRQSRLELLCDNLRLAISIAEELSMPATSTMQPVEMTLPQFLDFLQAQQEVWRMLTGYAVRIRFDNWVPKGANATISLVPDYAKRALTQLIQNAGEAIYGALATYQAETAPSPRSAKQATDKIESEARDEAERLASMQIRLWLTAEDTQLILHIHDNGPGVDTDIRDSLFLPGTTSRPGEHRGHGLAAVNRLAQLWGGTITLLPSETGAHFALSFPVVSCWHHLN